jgi:hypothetical protein
MFLQTHVLIIPILFFFWSNVKKYIKDKKIYNSENPEKPKIKYNSEELEKTRKKRKSKAS